MSIIQLAEIMSDSTVKSTNEFLNELRIKTFRSLTIK